MYPVDPDFNNVLQSYHSLLAGFVLKLKRQPRYRGVPTTDLWSMIEWAAWKAWLTQKRQAEPNQGMSPYQYGTYLSLWIRQAINHYSDVGKAKPGPYQTDRYILSDDLESVDANDFIEVNMKSLSDREQIVLRGMFYENKTLREMGKKMNLSYEMIRLIRKTALEKIRAKNN